MAEINKEISYRSLSKMVKPFGKPGQVSTRKLAPEKGWVGSVLYSERIGDTNEVKHTTFIVHNKEYAESYQAKQYINERLAIIFPAPVAVLVSGN